jgi:predicted small lipoprotein YifL
MRSVLLAAMLSLLLCSLAGCGTLMQGRAPLPEGYTVKDVAKADAGAPFALSRNGSIAAISKNTLGVIAPDGLIRKIADGTASLLSFSPGGGKLAAAVPAENQDLVRLFDSKGNVVGETTIPGKVTGIGWRSDAQVLLTVVQIKKFSFGSLLTGYLYQWDGASPPVATKLSDVTVRPALAKLPEADLLRNYQLAISPFGDEIAYTAIKDPPLFPSYQRVAIRHLESGVDRDVAVNAIGSGAPLYFPDGETLLLPNEHRLTRRLTIPEAKETDAWPSPGSYPALSPSGSFVYLDGRLYQDGRTITSFPAEARASFLPDGSGLVLSYQGKLYLVSGLNDRAAASLPADQERILTLRKLRSLGQITDKEYKTQKEALKK